MNPASSPDSKVSLRERFRTATREAILEAAADLLGADGGAQTRMEDIAARAGVAVGTVYNYFEDRKALVSALLESRTRSLLTELDAVVAPDRATVAPAAAVSPTEAFQAELAHFVEALGRHVESNRFLIGVLHEEEQLRGIDPKAATRKSTMLDELLSRAERLMEKGMKTKVLRKADPAFYAAMFIGMLRGVALSSLRQCQPVTTGRKDAVVQLFMTGAAR